MDWMNQLGGILQQYGTGTGTAPARDVENHFEQVAQAARELLDSLVTNAPPRDRDVEAAKARARAQERFHSAA